MRKLPDDVRKERLRVRELHKHRRLRAAKRERRRIMNELIRQRAKEANAKTNLV